MNRPTRPRRRGADAPGLPAAALPAAPTMPRRRGRAAAGTAATSHPAQPAATPDGASPAVPVATAPAVDWTEQRLRLTTAEAAHLRTLKKRAAALARPMKRGELLRLGLALLGRMPDAELFAALDAADLPRRR